MLKHIWAWISRERTRQTLAFLGGGLVVLVSALWTYIHEPAGEQHSVRAVAPESAMRAQTPGLEQEARAESHGIAINAGGQASVTVHESDR
jgi:type II secretory pathway component PulM